VSTDALPVLMVHYRAPDWLLESVRSVLASDIEVAITVVNNGGVIRDLPHGIEVMETGRNLGYAAAANVGLRRWLNGTTPYCVVASHDLDCRADTLRCLVDAAASNATFGVLAPNLPERPVPALDGVVEREVVIGTCMLLRRACIERVGLFDEQFGSYYEDYDLCMRARAAGWRVGAVAGAVASSHGTAHRRTAKRLSYANEVLLAGKHRGRWAATKRFTAMVGYAPRDFARAMTDPAHRSEHLLRGRARFGAIPRAVSVLTKTYRRGPDVS
jgi:N-acetylglucosaminyl-diphospho-decaprenol L-rhamnosyltransferase